MRTSIRGRLMLLVFASIVLVWTLALATSYRQATHEVEEWEDARLAQTAQLLTQLNQDDLVMLSRTTIDEREEQKGSADAGNEDDDGLPRNVLFQVRDASGHVLAGSPGLVALHEWDPPSPAVAGARNIDIDGQRWHTFTLHDDASGRSVRVLEPANTRSDLTSNVARRIARPIALALPVLALLVWISIGRSLASLKTVSEAIRTRDINKLEPIDVGRAPSEIRPLVDAINHVLARLRRSLERERAFTADAAHELKTPLAAIKVQAQVALGEPDTARQRLAMERVVRGVDRSARLADQLLLLARLDEHQRIATLPVELDAIAGDAVQAFEADARQKSMTLTLTGDAQPGTVIAEPVLIRILFDNLIDNAIKYGDTAGHIEVALRHDDGKVCLTVRDNGPGVAPADLAHLTHRFFRATGHQASGSGLGLSIAARIVEYFDAKLSFGAGIDGRGLAVDIAFPAYVATVTEASRPATID
ncbi:MAG TPA: ATP-binding protein [Paraburkholderia sp.]|nr:ATP-binding protein [Paraburkholderia sp.]